jgi:hypothetical protein
MTKVFYLLSLIVLCAPSVFAQSGNSDRCEVVIVDMKSKKGVLLGTFKTTIAEEELTTKSFPLPGTKLFIVASVFYTDESLSSSQGADSVSLELALSHSKKRNVLTSLSWAEAEMPLNGFDVGRVTMKVTAPGRRSLVIMECRKAQP